MTIEKAIEMLKSEIKIWQRVSDNDDVYWDAIDNIKTLDMAIKALEKQVPKKFEKVKLPKDITLDDGNVTFKKEHLFLLSVIAVHG